MKTFKDYMGKTKVNEENLNEVNLKKVAQDFLNYIRTQDFSEYDWDMGTTSGIEDYLDAIEEEDDDAKYYLEQDVASIDDIRDSLKYIEAIWKNGSKISKIKDKIAKYEAELVKLRKELEKLS